MNVAELRHELLTHERNTLPRLSPDGRSVAFVRTGPGGQELWLRTAGGTERRLAAHHGETLADLRWTGDGATVLYRATQRGRELWRLLACRPADRSSTELAAPVREYWLSARDPGAVAYCRGDRLYRVVLGSPAGPAELVAAGSRYHRWLVDGELRHRGGTRFTADGSLQVLLGDGDGGAARPVLEIDAEGAVDLAIAGFSRDGRRLYLLTSHGAKTRRLLSIESGTGAVGTVFEDPELDVDGYPVAGEGVWFDPRTGEPDLCTVMDQRLRYRPLDHRHDAALTALGSATDDPAVLVDRSADDRTWLVVDVHDDGPIAYRLVDPDTAASRPVFVNRPGLAGRRLARLVDFPVVAGDGWRLGGYAMRPPDREPPLPAVVMVHGGPAGRDMWRFHADAQYLATLGFASLHVNYRGSKGYGIGFRQAGNGEWGGRMQQDLYDAVAAGVDAGLVDPARVAFFGASYGGYAALLAACQRPDLVRCAVAIGAPCDLVSFVARPPAYWQPLSVLLRRQVGGTGLAGRSPAHLLTARCAPLLLAHGERDPRVPVAEVDRFAERAAGLGVPVRYLRFSDEGHHVRSNANRARLFAAIGEFLEVHCADR